MSGHRKDQSPCISRRALLRSMGMAPLLLRSAPFHGAEFLFGASEPLKMPDAAMSLRDIRLQPHYPAEPPLERLLRLVAPGSDEYSTEKYAFEIESRLREWSRTLKSSIRDLSGVARWLRPDLLGSALASVQETQVRSGYGIEVVRRRFGPAAMQKREAFVQQLRTWLAPLAEVETAEFEMYGIEQTSSAPVAVRLAIRYDLVSTRRDGRREERVGDWTMEWAQAENRDWHARLWQSGEETVSFLRGPAFIDVTAPAMAGVPSWKSQMLHGVDHWRTILDSACAIDIYNNTGIAAGDFDNDGLDDLYVCQPAGLPNRLYRNRGDGTFEDVTEQAGVGVLDNTACALFADFDNKGVQDLLVVCGTGPLLFLNDGKGKFLLKKDAFRFAQPPQGSFTHAAVADYDGDGRLDIYFCMYMYYLGLDQYHYPVPYYDARNGPPNCLLHNNGNGSFVETTQAAGLNADNNRYSFAAAWGHARSGGAPDLFVANDFGTSQLYRNNGDGTFTVVSKEAGVEGVGAGMGCCWQDFDNDGHQDVYVPSMWEAAGQRVSQQKQFHENAPERIRALYQRHARGNALYRNKGDGTFENIGHQAGVEMGRWSWSSDFLDFDQDGRPDLYVANGYISGIDRDDLASFFWRQVVAKSPEDSTPAPAYEQGWGAINELIRSDKSWHGYARNVFFANNGDGTFSEISGPAGLDFTDDSRSFALADLDRDGRPEIVLKNRNAPQLRILHNNLAETGHSIVFRLRGRQSNRDAIGTGITVEAGGLRQTRYLQAGSGFLAQHSKELFFGVGAGEKVSAMVRWPSGTVQHFADLPANRRIELEEGSPHFVATPFASAPASWAHAGPEFVQEALPTRADTWLIEPLKAPEFSLPDLRGRTRELKEWTGKFVLLVFWETNSPLCRAQLRQLDSARERFSAHRAEVVAVNVNPAADAAAVRALIAQDRLNLAVLFATEQAAGVYNIVYRYLFDRRRDLPLPTAFLLDPDGMITRVIQGELDPQHILDGIATAPANASERLRRALPFPGQLYQSAFGRNDYTYGVAFFQHGYLDQAESSFRQVVALRPDDAEAWYNLGTLSLRRKNLQQARDYLEHCVQLRPSYAEAWNNLGMIAAQQGQPDEAIRDFRQSLVLRPDYAVALLNLGNVFRRQHDFTGAESCLNRALAIAPEDPEVNYSYGMLRAQQNDMQRASEYLLKAIVLRPDYAEAINNLGVLYVRLQDYSRAEEQFRKCISVAPDFDQAYLNLASLYAMRSDRQDARAVLQQLLVIQPGNPAAQQALQMLQ
jgi:Flp pilus assembly protein TadD/peroxiredoxin